MLGEWCFTIDGQLTVGNWRDQWLMVVNMMLIHWRAGAGLVATHVTELLRIL